MKLFITLLSILLSSSLGAQSFDESKLIGTWTAVQVETAEMDLPAEQMEIMQVMKEGFVNSTYTFHSSGKFNIKFQEGVPDFMNELQFLDNTNWIFDQENFRISIGSVEDNYSLMVIQIWLKDGETVFQMDETPILMIMEKT